MLICFYLISNNAFSSVFIQPDALKPDITFWIKVYTEISNSQGFLHDNANLGVIYETVNIEGLSRKQRKGRIESSRKKYIKILKRLASGARSKLSAEEQRVLNMWPKNVKNSELKQAQERVRFQLGQSDKFKAGLQRSGRWRPFILKTLRDMRLPEEIASLPQVESSFNPKAYSHVGAAGMWQFMRSTGRRFMRVDHVVDERLDPFISSVSAARLLEQNYKTTGAWPLAITAYNHGAAGMRRAKRQVGSSDIVKIVRQYRSRTFKFASRNFYVAFLAAVNIHKDPEKYFGKMQFDQPEDNIRYRLPGYMYATTLADKAGISVNTLKRLNPALRPNVWAGSKYVPKGYEARLPTGQSRNFLAAALTGSAHNILFARQKPDVNYRVRRGDNLSSIAKRFGVSVRNLMAFNNIKRSNFIRVGQVLRLPQKAGVQPSVATINYGQYRVKAGDTLSQVAQNFGMGVNTLMALNGLTDKNHLAVGQTLRVRGIPTKQSTENLQNYTVKSGDTLSEVAQRFNISQSTLMALNGLTNRNVIVPGQILRLTSDSTSGAEKSVSATKTPDFETEIYAVKKGDSLISIANRYGIGLSELLAINDVRRRDVLRVGYELKVPKIGPPTLRKGVPAEYVVTRGDTLSDIAERFGLKQEDLLAINGLTNKNVIVPGQTLRLTTVSDPIPVATDYISYRVKKGDSLISIANRHTVSLRELLAVNDVREKNVLRVGQTLKLPQPRHDTPPRVVIATETGEESGPQEATPELPEEPESELSEEEIGALEATPALEGAEAIAVDSRGADEDGDSTFDSESTVPSVASSQPVLAADPNDYAVSDDNRIVVLAGETLGHYADWLKIKTNELRKLNNMRFGNPVVIGNKIRLKFGDVNKDSFENARLAYHTALQETYFEEFKIDESAEYTVKSGDSIWSLTQKNNVPLWLLMQYNPDLSVGQLKSGDKIILPKIIEKND